MRKPTSSYLNNFTSLSGTIPNIRYKNLQFLFTGLFLLASSMYRQSFAQNSFLVSNQQKSFYVAASYIHYLPDPTGNWTIDSIRTKPFLPANESDLKMPNNPSVYWLKCSLQDTSASATNWVLELVDFTIDQVEVYYSNENNSYTRVARTGDYLAFETRAYAHKNFVLDLPLRSKKPRTVYLRFENKGGGSFYMKFLVKNYSSFVKYALTEYSLLTFFYGILICMGMYNLFLFFYLKEWSHLFYFQYIVGILFYGLSHIDGLGFQFLWSNHPELNPYISIFALTLLITGALSFANSFLEPVQFSPLLHKFLIAFIGLRILAGLAESIVPFGQDGFRYFDSICLLLCFLSGVFGWYKKSKAAHYYMLAFGFLFLGFIVHTLQFTTLLPNSILTFYSINIGVVLEVFLLSMALAHKVRTISKEKAEAQSIALNQFMENEQLQKTLITELKEKELLTDKVNRELESKVSERTHALQSKTLELLDANKQLEEQAKEINRINSLLDIQNWELKKELKSEVTARITDEELPYDEFLKIYPDDLACYRYLENLKWKDGYICSKCGNTKFKANPETFDRKCSRCSAKESVTSSTLFHGIKFQLNKAFYIVYYCSHKNYQINATYLSSLISMRVGTCNDFYKKILERKTLLEKKNKKANLNWERLILEPEN